MIHFLASVSFLFLFGLLVLLGFLLLLLLFLWLVLFFVIILLVEELFGIHHVFKESPWSHLETLLRLFLVKFYLLVNHRLHLQGLRNTGGLPNLHELLRFQIGDREVLDGGGGGDQASESRKQFHFKIIL